MSEDHRPTAAEQMMQAVKRFTEDFGRALAAEGERLRPTIRLLAEIASRPEVQAAMRNAKAMQALREARSCYCLCGRAHPGDKGICDGEGVTTRRFDSPHTGPVDVSLCAPCAVAQGVRELAGP